MTEIINPYNFFAPSAAVPREPVETAPGWALLAPDCHSGYLEVDIVILTRLFIPSRLQGDIEYVMTTDKHPAKEHPVYHRLLYEIAQKRKTIPGTSVKGPVRSVIEALSDSCMGQFAGKYKQDRNDQEKRLDYRAMAPSETLPGRCCLRSETGGPITDPADGLCVACRLFGIAAGGGAEPDAGEVTALQGRVTFEDFFLAESSSNKISKETITLPELSDPKPRHAPFYLDAGGNIRGRKFYLHHEPGSLQTEVKTKRNCTIQESILPHAHFTGCVRFSNLTDREVGLLLWGLELDDAPPFDSQGNRTPGLLAHKLGMGKPLGLGSVKIRVRHMSLMEPAARYGAFDWPEKEKAGLVKAISDHDFRQRLHAFKESWAEDPFENRDQLRSLLTFPAHRASRVAYPTFNWFPCSHVGLPTEVDGTLPDPCPTAVGTPSTRKSSPRFSKPLDTLRSAIPQSGKGRQEKPLRKEATVKVIEVMGNKAWVDFEGESLEVAGLNRFLGIKVEDRIKVRLIRLPGGGIKAEFKSLVKS